MSSLLLHQAGRKEKVPARDDSLVQQPGRGTVFDLAHPVGDVDHLPAEFIPEVVPLHLRDGRCPVREIDDRVIRHLEEGPADQSPLVPLPFDSMSLDDRRNSNDPRKDGKYGRPDGMDMHDIRVAPSHHVAYRVVADG